MAHCRMPIGVTLRQPYVRAHIPGQRTPTSSRAFTAESHAALAAAARKVRRPSPGPSPAPSKGGTGVGTCHRIAEQQSLAAGGEWTDRAFGTVVVDRQIARLRVAGRAQHRQQARHKPQPCGAIPISSCLPFQFKRKQAWMTTPNSGYPTWRPGVMT